MTVSQALDKVTQNKALRKLLTYNWGNYGLPPSKASWAMHCMVQNHYLYGAAYPTGGAGQIAKKIIPTIQKSGGQVFVRAPVRSIMVDEETGCATGIVLARDNSEVRCSTVISSVGVWNTCVRLVPPAQRHLVADLVKAVQVHIYIFFIFFSFFSFFSFFVSFYISRLQI
jgi:phytoene dehydrogenase-like protein